MVQPEIYAKNVKVHFDYVAEIYDKFLKSLGWTENQNFTILDIGCGAGNIFFNVLVPRLPENCTKIVASDKSEAMVQYCKTRSTSNKTEFVRIDIETDHLSDNLKNSFDHMFSTFCLQYILDFRKTLQNCFNMLKPGGGLIFIFPTKNIIYDAYDELCKIDKWFPYVKNFKNYKAVFDNKDAEYVQRYFEESGFIVKSCKVDNKIISFPNMSALDDSIYSMDTIEPKIPEAEKKMYMKDFQLAYKKFEYLTLEHNKGLEIPNLLLKPVIIVAQKPF